MVKLQHFLDWIAQHCPKNSGCSPLGRLELLLDSMEGRDAEARETIARLRASMRHYHMALFSVDVGEDWEWPDLEDKR